MIDYVYIGKIVNTHALKGEVRIISDFEFKDRVFKINTILFIGNEKSKEEIESYRVHKQYDMVKFKGIDNITDVLKYKSKNVFVKKESLSLEDDEILIEDLCLYSISYNNEIIGKVMEYRSDNGNEMIFVRGKYIPYNRDFIESIDKEKYIIYYKNIGGLI